MPPRDDPEAPLQQVVQNMRTADSPCKVCGMDAYYLCDTPNEHGEVRTIHHYRCRHCGLVFVGNHLTDEQLGAAYATLDPAAYYDEVGRTEERKFAASLADMESLGIDRKGSIIDVGTGNGAFLLFLQRQGFLRLSGHEIPGADTGELDRNGIPVYRDYDWRTVPSSSFDAVTLLDVLEHVPDPWKVSREVYRLLKPGGLLYLHTPCVTRTDRLMHGLQKVPLARKVGRTWQRGRTSIFHLQNYTPASLRLVLDRSGYADVRIRRMNELSWPVRRYVRVYLCEKQGLPGFLSYLAAPLLYPFLATSLFNANKAVVVARKPVDGPVPLR
jgi:SAM-dependent methyltransferase